TSNGVSVNSMWARGQAFGIYGFAMGYRYTHDPALLAAAQRVADFFIAHQPPDSVPYWDYTQTNYKDSSAAAIAAAGLIELSRYVTDVTKQSSYSNAASQIQSFLSNPSFYLGDPAKTDGVLLHGAYYVPGKLDVDNSLIWGDYFFVQGCFRAMAPPPQVIGLTANSVFPNQASLHWQSPQPAAIRYYVNRSSTPGGPYTVIAPPPVLTATTFTDTGLTPGATYYYVVSASSPGGDGPDSAEFVVTTPFPPPDFSISASPPTLNVSQNVPG